MRSILFFMILPFAVVCGESVAQEREWTFDVTDQDAFLVFGTPNTDDVGLSLWCKIASKRVKIFVAEPLSKQTAGKSVTLAVEANGSTYDLAAKTSENDQISGVSVEAEVLTSDPVVAAMKNSDFISIATGSHVSRYPLTDADLGRLLRLCGG